MLVAGGDNRVDDRGGMHGSAEVGSAGHAFIRRAQEFGELDDDHVVVAEATARAHAAT